VHRDPDLLAALAARRLAPLEQLRDSSRERFAGDAARLAAAPRRAAAPVAAALHVHPQTVGYRLGNAARDVRHPCWTTRRGGSSSKLALRGRR
jgi:hypothetical protein